MKSVESLAALSLLGDPLRFQGPDSRKFWRHLANAAGMPVEPSCPSGPCGAHMGSPSVAPQPGEPSAKKCNTIMLSALAIRCQTLQQSPTPYGPASS